MKPIESDRHFIAEYYIRKWFRVVWLENGLWLTKKDSLIDCIIPYINGNVREFIEKTDIYLRWLLEWVK